MIEAQSKARFFSNRIGFILSTAGSAIGLANIWKFPYVVGEFGGGGFIILYFFFLFMIGFPAFFSEILIGKITGKRPDDAYESLGKSKTWGKIGLGTMWTGFFVSSFYSVVAGWILGYLYEALRGNLLFIQTIPQAHGHYLSLMQEPFWSLFFHFIFAMICLWFLIGGIRKGIEKCNKICMPIFFIVLSLLLVWTFTLPTAKETVNFFLRCDFSKISPQAVIIALGHAFFTLSVGQGTLVTYGSYLKPHSKILSSASLVVLTDTLVSLASAFCILSIVAFGNQNIQFGPGLIFETLPTIFSTVSGGYSLCAGFFFLVFIAALTSQVSALEPLIAHITEKFSMNRRKASGLVVLASFLIGVPSALSQSSLSTLTFFDNTFFDIMNFTTTSMLVPLGGLASVLLIGWKYGVQNALNHLTGEEQHFLQKQSFIKKYFKISIAFIAPIFIIFVFAHAIGVI